MSRRPLLAAAAAALCAAAVWAGGCAEEAPTTNVVLVVVDTLRADHMSLYGYERETTPELDAWARGGTVVERAWSASSWTTPSMAMLLTGVPRADNSGEIDASTPSLAELLQGEGYRTWAVVSNPLLNERLGYDRGFDAFDVLRHDADRGLTDGWPAGEVVDRGIALLEGRDERPFYLWLHLFDPHYPYVPEAPPPFRPEADPERRARMLEALPPDERHLLTDEAYRGIETLIALYDAEVRDADRALGRLFAYLEEEGLADETLVVVTSDHGEGLWQRAPAEGEAPKTAVHFPHLYYSHGVQLYEEQVRVPLVLRGPGVPAGRRIAAARSTLDVLPTILARLGLEPPAGARGADLVALDDAPAWREIYSVCSRGTTVTVDGRFRLHVPRAYRVERFGARPELYDLATDPLERRPLADPERTAALAELVARWRARYGGDAPAPLDPEQAALLEALGYAGEADR